MQKNTVHTGARLLACLISVILILTGMEPLGLLLRNGTVRADSSDGVICNATVYCEGNGAYVNVRTAAGTTNSDIITQLYRGARVRINEYVRVPNDPSGYDNWCSITFMLGESEINGYIVEKNLQIDILSTPDFEQAISGFPESYKPYLRRLHEKYPSWEFVPLETTADWETSLKAETRLGVSAISSSVPANWKSHAPGAYDPATGEYKQIDSGGWVNADPQVVAYFLDPRNMLFESQVFQFLDLGYDPQVHTIDAVNGVINGTFMKKWGVWKDDGTLIGHDQAFMEAAELTGMSPVYLASKVVQEVGASGSDSVFGTGHNGAFPGYYNYYNIGAFAVPGMDAVTRGLWFASCSNGDQEEYMRPWNNGYRSIVGGALWQAKNYYQAGQNTLYLMKFNVTPKDASSVGNHQYMTNIRALENESAKMYKGYSSIGKLSDHLVFKIPVYKNIPEHTALMPSSLGIDEFVKNIYQSALGSAPSATDLQAWAAAIRNGTANPSNLAFELVYVPGVLFQEMDDEAYLTYIYQALLAREIDDDGKEHMLERLKSGQTRCEIVTLILNSPEFQARISRYSMTPQVFEPSAKQQAYDNDAKFICRLYRKTFTRDPDASGFEFWVGKLRNEDMSYSELVKNFALSEEAKKTFTTNESFLNMLYNAIFDREADEGGFEYWLAYMDFGMVREEVLEGFLQAQEFVNLCNRYGGKQGSYKSPVSSGIDKSLNVTGVSDFIKRMYEVVLDRDPEYDGYVFWGERICKHQSKGADMAQSFVFSDEYLNKKTTDEEYIKMLYRAILGREAEDDGFEFWMEHLSKDMTRQQVLDGFVASDEYSNICAHYGIEK